MSDLSAHESPRPVSLFVVFSVFVLFALFAVVLRYYYWPNHTSSYAGDGIHTVEQRTETLKKLRDAQIPLVTTTKYAWVDQKAGVVRLPMDRAIDLTVQRYSTKK